MKKVIEKLKTFKELIVMIVGVISIIITCYKMYDNFNNDLSLLQKNNTSNNDMVKGCTTS